MNALAWQEFAGQKSRTLGFIRSGNQPLIDASFNSAPVFFQSSVTNKSRETSLEIHDCWKCGKEMARYSRKDLAKNRRTRISYFKLTAVLKLESLIQAVQIYIYTLSIIIMNHLRGHAPFRLPCAGLHPAEPNAIPTPSILLPWTQLFL